MNFSAEPSNFVNNQSALTDENKPNWGTCTADNTPPVVTITGYTLIEVELNTTFTPFQFLDKIYDIEKMLGRSIDREKNAPRTIDIDIVLFEDVFMETAELTIPHSHALFRKFVLVPLAELVPDKIFPGTKHKMIDLLEKCPDTSTVDKYLIDKKA